MSVAEYIAIVTALVAIGTLWRSIAEYVRQRCWRSENFWSNLNREQQAWAHFRDFVSRLETMERSFVPSRKAYRL